MLVDWLLLVMILGILLRLVLLIMRSLLVRLLIRIIMVRRLVLKRPKLFVMFVVVFLVKELMNVLLLRLFIFF